MKHFTKGNTVIEIMIAIAILILMIAIIVPVLSSFRNQQALKNTTEDVVSLLNEAFVKTNSSYNSTYYSVHFASSSATLFTGGTYSSSASDNKVVTFDPVVTLPSADISLSGGGVNVSFTRLSGDVTQYGTLTLRLASDSTKTKVITINKTGIISAN